MQQFLQQNPAPYVPRNWPTRNIPSASGTLLPSYHQPYGQGEDTSQARFNLVIAAGARALMTPGRDCRRRLPRCVCFRQTLTSTGTCYCSVCIFASAFVGCLIYAMIALTRLSTYHAWDRNVEFDNEIRIP